MLINTNLYNESTDNVFSYINQINNNYNAIIEAARISELRYYQDTGNSLFITESGVLGNLIHRIVEFFKNLLNKIISLFKKSETQTTITVKKKAKEIERTIDDIKNKRKLKGTAPSSGSYKGNTSFSKKPKTKSSSISEPENSATDDNNTSNKNKEDSSSLDYSDYVEIVNDDPILPEIKFDGYKFWCSDHSYTLNGNYSSIHSDILDEYLSLYNDLLLSAKNIKYSELKGDNYDDDSVDYPEYIFAADKIIKKINEGKSNKEMEEFFTIRLYKDMYRHYLTKDLRVKKYTNVKELQEDLMRLFVEQKIEVTVTVDDKYLNQVKNFINRGFYDIMNSMKKDEKFFETDIKKLINDLTKKEKEIKNGEIKVDNENIIRVINIVNVVVSNGYQSSIVFFKALSTSMIKMLDQQERILRMIRSMDYSEGGD